MLLEQQVHRLLCLSMPKKTRLIPPLLISGFFVLLDQTFKYTARLIPDHSYFPIPYIGWDYFANPGIAFSLPFPNSVLIIITPIIVLLLVLLLLRSGTRQSNPLFTFGILLIIGGAISNYIDRLLFEVTIDYFRIFTGIINLADVMIVVGAGLLLLSERKKEKKSS